MKTLTDTIKNRAVTFTRDNFSNPPEQNFHIIESAMLIGASIAIEKQMEGLHRVSKAAREEEEIARAVVNKIFNDADREAANARILLDNKS
jgi:uncharacterized protein YycO